MQLELPYMYVKEVIMPETVLDRAMIIKDCNNRKLYIVGEWSVAALHQGAPGQMTWLKSDPPWLAPWLRTRLTKISINFTDIACINL